MDSKSQVFEVPIHMQSLRKETYVWICCIARAAQTIDNGK